MRAEEYRALAQELLSPKRYRHTLAVERLARELAQRHGADVQAAGEAALLHDLMKERTVSELLQTIGNSDILQSNSPDTNPGALHALAGFCYARDRLFVEDGDVLNAVRYHTTGRADMSLLEKVVFAADKYSYDRSYRGIEDYRTLAFQDLDESLLAFFDFQIPKQLRLRERISPDSIRCYNSLCAG